ncbi:hypothetical protein BLA60_03475 [Actinophytocola xinjiangensis]|uniref:Uncharacterized protein n=1 Tax=Actinophytocola xinjiangensis TaxID=485602 RepID=A0A7Z1B0W0_9PSEU|nr:hypothetical protein [Actinophytocola xinjiangensis]OLF14213.1 hypothetical protein BLA60_03475 [Actinophytocola xinjiangensis]
MTVLLCGANPAVRLFDGDDVTAFASVWTVDWSVHGPGRAIVLWHDGRVRVLADDPTLGGWLERAFVRHFPEAAGLPWPEPTPERAEVTVDLDLRDGLSARAGDVAVTVSGALAVRTFETDAFPLDGVPHALRLVLAPAADASVTIGGTPVAGAVRREGGAERPSSSAFLTTAEVWSLAPDSS